MKKYPFLRRLAVRGDRCYFILPKSMTSQKGFSPGKEYDIYSVEGRREQKIGKKSPYSIIRMGKNRRVNLPLKTIKGLGWKDRDKLEIGFLGNSLKEEPYKMRVLGLAIHNPNKRGTFLELKLQGEPAIMCWMPTIRHYILETGGTGRRAEVNAEKIQMVIDKERFRGRMKFERRMNSQPKLSLSPWSAGKIYYRGYYRDEAGKKLTPCYEPIGEECSDCPLSLIIVYEERDKRMFPVFWYVSDWIASNKVGMVEVISETNLINPRSR